MRSYAYYEHLSAKTRALNTLRRPFQWRPLEGLLRRFVRGSDPGSWRARLIPPEYLYAPGTWREGAIDDLHCRLDLSDTVCHSHWFGLADRGADRFLATVRPDSVVVDIGANIGLRAMAFAKAAPEGRVIALEPHPVSHERLVAHARANGLGNIAALRLGIGSKPQTVRLYEVLSTNPGMNRILSDPEAEGHFTSREIEIAPLQQALDRAGAQGVTHIKIDVEGYEMEVLRGSEQVILRDRPLLFIELDDDNLRDNGSSAQQLVGLLQRWGYRVARAEDGQPLAGDLAHCHMDIACEPGGGENAAGPA